jgi:hypothetical protein
MKFRTLGLALALACGFTAPIEAKQKTTTNYHAKPGKSKKPKIQKYKPGKFKPAKFKPAKVK